MSDLLQKLWEAHFPPWVQAVFFVLLWVPVGVLVRKLWRRVDYLYRDQLRRAEWIRTHPYQSETDPPLRKTAWPENQPWREATDIGLIEKFKKELISYEKFLVAVQTIANGFLERRRALTEQNAGRLRWLWFACVETPKRTRAEPAAQFERYKKYQTYFEMASDLCIKIDRIWSGNAHQETEDCKEQIEKLQIRGKDRSLYGEEIATLNRQLRDLEELVRRAKERLNVAHKEKYEEMLSRHHFDIRQDIAKHFADVPTMMEAMNEAKLYLERVSKGNYTTEEKEDLEEFISTKLEELKEKLSPETKTNVVRIYKEEG